jgi:hypothetical protein
VAICFGVSIQKTNSKPIAIADMVNSLVDLCMLHQNKRSQKAVLKVARK